VVIGDTATFDGLAGDARREWWAHLVAQFEFTRINTTPTFLRNKFEDAREVSAIVGFRAAAALWP